MSLGLNAAGDIYLGSRSGVAIVTGADEVAQGIRTKLRLFLGEWFLDTTKGVPYFEEIFSGVYDHARIESVLRAQIRSQSGVTEITSFSTSFDRAGRALTVNFEVDTIYGPSGPIEIGVSV